jgi:thiamine pyrophosphokinase
VRAVVVAGGEAHARDLDEVDAADLVVAADGGASWLATMGRRPDVLVGDLDSIDAPLAERLAQAGTVVERHPVDKAATDAELALDRAVAAGADRIVLLGVLGGDRLDHELANLLLLADARWTASVRDLRIARGGTLVRVLRGAASLELEANVGDMVSLLPLGGDAGGVRTHGLRFALDGEPLDFGRSRGISNVVMDLPASVSIEHGVLLVFEIAKGVDL